LRQLRANVVVEELEPSRIQPDQVLVERVNEDPERQIPLELRAGSRHHEVFTRVGARRQLGEQARLADPRLPGDFDRGRPPPSELAERSIERVELGVPPDEMFGELKRRRPPQA
jgi:hypothetical protein